MEFKFLNDSIIGELNDKGIWVYKANPDMQLKAPFKKDGTLKQAYKDLPRFKCIIEAEDKFVKNYNKELVASIREAAQILNSFGQ